MGGHKYRVISMVTILITLFWVLTTLVIIATHEPPQYS